MKEAVCKECHKFRGIIARGYCSSCYQHLRYHGRLSVRSSTPGAAAQEHLDSIERIDGCWPWPGCIDISLGYGRVSVAGQRTQLAHIWVYQKLVGAIPPKYEIDHLCHNDDLSCIGGIDCPHRACVNPDHLEAVPKIVNNLRRKTGERNKSCRAGHERNDENTLVRVVNGRTTYVCRKCHNLRNQAYKQRKRAS